MFYWLGVLRDSFLEVTLLKDIGNNKNPGTSVLGWGSRGALLLLLQQKLYVANMRNVG